MLQGNIKRLLVFDLTDESNGNALGIGRADLITKKVYDKIDFETTYTNVITSTFLERGKIPIAASSEKEAFDIAIKTLWNLPGTVPRVVIIRNTLKLDKLYVSQPVWEEIKARPNIITTGEGEILKFTGKGDLQLRI